MGRSAPVELYSDFIDNVGDCGELREGLGVRQAAVWRLCGPDGRRPAARNRSPSARPRFEMFHARWTVVGPTRMEHGRIILRELPCRDAAG